MWDTLTKEWEKGVIISQAETPRSYIVKHHKEKRRNRIHLREASPIQCPMHPLCKRWNMCYCLQRNNQKYKVCFNQMRKKVSQSAVENVPKANVQSLLRPMIKLVPTANMQSVHSSRVNSTVNSAGKESAHNQSERSAKGINSAPKLAVRKNQGLVQGDSKGVLTTPPWIGNNNKTIPKVSASKSLTLNPVFRRITVLGDQQGRGKQTILLIFLPSSLALTFGTQNHNTKVTFTWYEN